MKNKLFIVGLVGILTFGSITYAIAAPMVTYQDTLIPFTDNAYDLGTSTQAWRNIYAHNVTVTGTCTGCGGGSSGSVSTSTHEVAGQIPYFTSNSATPALIGGSPNFTFDGISGVNLGSAQAFQLGGGFQFSSTTNNYVGDQVTNTNGGSTASANYFVTNDAGALGQFGIVSSGWSSAAAEVPNDVYLYSGNGLNIETDSASPIRFITGGDVPGNIRGQITAIGQFAIGTSTPWGQFSASSTSAFPTLSIEQKSTGPAAIFLGGSIGIGTTTPGTLLALGNTGANTITISTTATSTFGSGINVKTGCLAVNGTCVGSGAGTVTSVATNNGLTGGTITTSGTIGLAAITANSVLANQTNASAVPTALATSSLGVALSDTTGTLALARGGTATTTFYSGGVVFSDASKLTQSTNTGTGRFFWDNTNNRLGIGTSTPARPLNVTGTGNTQDQQIIEDTNGGTNQHYIGFNNVAGAFNVDSLTDALATTTLTTTSTSSAALLIVNTGGSLGVGTTSPWRNLDVNGTVGFKGITTASGGNAICLSTNNEVQNAGASTCAVSTQKAKHDIQNLDLGVVSDLEQLNVVSYILNGSEKPQYGVIAEQAAAIDPTLVEFANQDITVMGPDGQPVTIQKGDPLTLDDRSFNGLLIAGWKYLDNEIQSIFSRLSGDESQIQAQQVEINLLEQEVKALQSK